MKKEALGLLVTAVATAGLATVAAPAQADTQWKCKTWEPLLFADSGGCTEAIYNRKDMGKWCKVRVDAVGFYTTDHWYSYNDPAARIYSLDLQNAKETFLFSRYDVAVKNDTPHAHRWWNKKKTWNGKSVRVTTDFKLYLKGQPDQSATTWFTIGPFNKNCK